MSITPTSKEQTVGDAAATSECGEPEPVGANLDPSRPDTPAYTPGQRHVAHILAKPHVCVYEPAPELGGVSL